MNTEFEFSELINDHNRRYILIRADYLIRNSITGAYLCDSGMNRLVFHGYKAVADEMKRRSLSENSYEAVRV